MQTHPTSRIVHFPHGVAGSEIQRRPSRAELYTWVRRYGTNSSSYVLLEGPKSYFTSAAVDGFLAYQISAGIALIAADPVCAPGRARKLIHDFVAAIKRPVGAYQVSPLMLEAFREEGFGDVQVGKEAIFDLDHFTLAGGEMELVRAATNKARREGVVVTEHHPFAIGSKALNLELRVISEEWLRDKGHHELGFLLGSLGLERPSAKRYYIARSGKGAGRIEGFIVCEPIYGRKGYYLDVTRRRADAVRGTMELLTTEIFRFLRDEGCELVSMGLAPLALLDDPDLSAHPRLTRLMRFVYQRVNTGYDFKLLYRYKAKYHPHAWEPRYFCFNQQRLSIGMLYALIKVRNTNSFDRLFGRNSGDAGSLQDKIKTWKHVASLVVGVCSALLSSS
jgi:phosphatidylglycerol lysyltransferase